MLKVAACPLFTSIVEGVTAISGRPSLTNTGVRLLLPQAAVPVDTASTKKAVSLVILFAGKEGPVNKGVPPVYSAYQRKVAPAGDIALNVTLPPEQARNKLSCTLASGAVALA